VALVTAAQKKSDSSFGYQKAVNLFHQKNCFTTKTLFYLM